MIPPIFPKVPQSSLGILRGSPVTASPWTPPHLKNPIIVVKVQPTKANYLCQENLKSISSWKRCVYKSVVYSNDLSLKISYVYIYIDIHTYSKEMHTVNMIKIH